MLNLFFLLTLSSIIATNLPINPQKISLSYKSYTKKKKKDLYVSQIIYDGEFIILSDNSVWNISNEDVLRSGVWFSTSAIIIKKSNNKSYPYKLYNTLTEDSILAKKSSLKEIKKSTSKIKEKRA